MSSLAGRRVVLGVGGGIAAYKAAELVRLLTGAGASVHCILTAAGARFITPLTLQTLSGHPVGLDLFSLTEESQIGHIRLADEADLLVIAPATADLLARLATGQADDLLTTVALATRAPLVVAPAMNVQMWDNPLTQANVHRLVELRGAHVVGPATGELACGWTGAGRLVEPVAILAALEHILTPAASAASAPGHASAPSSSATAKGGSALPNHAAAAAMGGSALPNHTAGRCAGQRWLVTAGPTHEPVDPVRFLGNRSSGKMGYAIARAAAEAGAEVVLLSGPTALAAPAGVERVSITTALELQRAVDERFARVDVVVMAAAVADFRPAHVSTTKLTRGAANVPLTLVANPDILAELGGRRAGASRPLLVGFAAEVGPLSTDGAAAERVARKLQAKGCDLLIANDITEPDAGFDVDTNRVVLFAPTTAPEPLEMMSKQKLAAALVERLASRISATS